MGDLSGARDFQRRVAAYNNRQAELEAERPTVPAVPPLRENIRFPARVVGAALAGVLAVFISRYIRFHLNGGALAGDGADLGMIMDGALAAAAGFALRQIFKFEAAVFLTAFNFGVAATIVTMHNLVHLAPAPFALVFSEDWVAQVIETTEPKSILFMGESISLASEGGGKEAGKPNVFRVGQ